jgi:hypothetical protein
MAMVVHGEAAAEIVDDGDGVRPMPREAAP